MKTLIVMAVLSTLAFGATEFGAQVGYWFPTGDAGDVYGGNFYFGGQFLSHMPLFAIEAAIGYTPLKLDTEVAGVDFSGHIIPIAVGLRSYSGSLYAAGGLELDMVSAKTEVLGVETSDTSDNYFGGYIGAGLIAPLVGVGDLDLNARVHFMDFDDLWMGLCVGINF